MAERGLDRAAFAGARRRADREGARSPRAAAWACRAGCASCCHLLVRVGAREAAAIASSLAVTPDLLARLAENARRARGLGPAAYRRARIRCALLGPNDRCRAYDARPLRCRAHVSFSKEACEAAPDGAPAPRDPWPARVVDALVAGLGEPADLELHAALHGTLHGTLQGALASAAGPWHRAGSPRGTRMYTTSDLKKNLLIQYEGAPHVVESIKVSAPTARGAATVTRVRLRNMITRQKTDVSFRGSETFAEADFERRPCQLLYEQQGTFHFMDGESFEQFSLERDDLEWESKFLVDGLEGLAALKTGERIFGLELPNQVVLRVTETAPSIKGATAAARTKPATLETGHVVQVPEHVGEGDRLKVDTRTGEFLGRA